VGIASEGRFKDSAMGHSNQRGEEEQFCIMIRLDVAIGWIISIINKYLILIFNVLSCVWG
jgi:hypothetical protein